MFYSILEKALKTYTPYKNTILREEKKTWLEKEEVEERTYKEKS